MIAKRDELERQRYGLPARIGQPPRQTTDARRRSPEPDAGRNMRYRPTPPPERRHSPPQYSDYKNRERNYQSHRPSEWTERRTEMRPASRYDNRNPSEPRNGDRVTRNFETSRNDKWCRYCKNRGHEIEECRKRQYNNSRFSGPGNGQDPPRGMDAPRADPLRNARPVNTVETAREEAQTPESQS
ncbi:hypothetical protein P5V15_014342 [Pogonomyrmex californicus]